MVDLSQELGEGFSFDGFDISDDAFLPSDRRPENVSLTVCDVRKPPPPERMGKYDVVCIRFINAALTPEDWPKVAMHAARMLSPGGALQWIEGDLLQLMTILRTEPDNKTSALERGFSQALTGQQQLEWFVPNLPTVLKDAGFENMRHDVTDGDRVAEDREEMSVTCIGAIYSVLRKQARSGASGMPTVEEVERMRDEMTQEARRGAYMRADFHQFIAFKKA